MRGGELSAYHSTDNLQLSAVHLVHVPCIHLARTNQLAGHGRTSELIE